jgi:HK97 family phage prohead protease
MKQKHQIKVDDCHIKAEFTSSSLNVETRTVEMVATTDAPVKRYDWNRDTDFNEVLSFEKGHFRTARLEKGIPLLDDHDRYDGIAGVIGVVESYKTEGNSLVVTARFANTEKGNQAMELVKDGIIRNVSIGYKVHKYEQQAGYDPKGKDLPTYKATDWEPMEVSLVPIPADPYAGVRSENPSRNAYSVPLSNPIQNPMDEPVKEEGGTTTPPTTEETLRKEQEIATRAKQAERTRVKEIQEAAKAANLSDEFVRSHVEGDTTVDAFRKLALEEMAKGNPTIRGDVSVTGKEEAEKERRIIETALMIRGNALTLSQLSITPEGRAEAQAVRPFLGARLIDFARKSLEDAGVNIKNIYDPMEIAKMALSHRSITSSTSDFSVLLEGTARRVMEAAYVAQAYDWDRFCATGNVGDFRDYKRVRMDENFNRLSKLAENGEYKRLPIGDARQESVKVETYGNTIDVSRQMIINDDLDAFTRLPAQFARAAARTIQLSVYELLQLNSGLGPVMADGLTLFHADHGNIATTPGAISSDIWDKMRVQLATVKPDGGKVNDFLNFRPDILLCPVGMGSKARLLNNSQVDPNVTNNIQIPNISAGLFREIVDTPYLSGTPYYAFANPNEAPIIEVSFLNGVRTPFLETDQPFEVDGMRWKIRLDFGVAAVNYKGVIRNAGA